MANATVNSIARKLRRHDVLQATIDALPHLVWICQSDGTAAYFNARWQEYTGLTVRQLWGRGWTDAVFPEDLNEIDLAWEDALQRSDHWMGRYRLKRHDGSFRWFESRAERVSLLTPDDHHWVGTTTDIHDAVEALDQAQKARLALIAKEARLQAVVDHSPLAILLSDSNGETIFSNPAFKRMLDLDDASAMKRDWVDAIHPDDRPRMIEHQRRMLMGIDYQFELEFRYIGRAGGTRVIRSRVVRAGSDDTDFTFIGMGEDMTLKRQVQADNERILKQALTSQKAEALGQLAGGIAHDFKNLLSVVEGFGSLALQHRATQDAPELRGFVDAIVAAGRRGRDLIAKLLAFSQPSPSTRPTATAIEPVVGEVVALLQAVIPATIRLELVITATVPPILIAPIDLHQVLVNLVVNARDAMGGSGEIRITVGEPMPVGAVCASCHTALPDLPVQVSVKDNGHGMNEGTLTRAFEPFFTTKEFAQGTGMGLAVVNGLVHQAGGHIAVESEDGAGCVFRLFFAAAEGVMGTPPASEAVSRSGVILVGLRVLVVEDDDALRCFLREVLEADQMIVTVAMNGPAALALALTTPVDYDVLITDHTMPEMTGVELVQALRANGILWPVVLFSGHSDSVRGAPDELDIVFVGKPASPQDIFAALEHAVGLPMSGADAEPSDT